MGPPSYFGPKSRLLSPYYSTDFIHCALEILSMSSFTGLEDTTRKIFGVQFHPEVDLTTCGKTLFNNFLIGVSECLSCSLI